MAGTYACGQEWGYGRASRSTPPIDDLVHERYRGIRPAPGYPGMPRSHRKTAPSGSLLDVERTRPVSGLTGEFRDVARGVGHAASISRTPNPAISRSARSAATRSRTTPDARSSP